MRKTTGVLLVLGMIQGCGDEAGVAVGAPGDDADGDTISNAQEGMAEAVDTDEDGFADYLDYDSDGDGILDADEAGDGDLSTEPIDTDEDGTPDYRDLDSDGDNIDDTRELNVDFQLVDSDDDGLFDHLDIDADADTILDRHELEDDRDNDAIANFRDRDADGDGIPDAIEAGDDDLDTVPIDSDGDQTPDFLDLDSDGDFIPDADEDKNGNGVVDPGESDPTSSDTDGDGIPDIVEIIAGSDPNNPDDLIPAGDFYFVLPYEGPGESGTLDFATTVKKADVFFSMDTTGSFGEEIAAVRAALSLTIVPGINAVVPDAAFGVGRFEDMPLAPFGLPGDKPYELLQLITTDISLVGDGLTALAPAAGGLDTPEAGFESLYQWASGVGMPEFGYPPFAPPGIGGVGFREDALPIIVQISDAKSHTAADYLPAVTGAHTEAETVAALNAIGARVIGIDSLEWAQDADCVANLPACNDPRPYLQAMALATKAFIPPDAGDGMCHFGVNDAPLPPVMLNGNDVCPVVLDVLPDGTGLGVSIVDAVVQLAQFGVLDISTETIGELKGINEEVITPGFTTADFIKSVTPVAPAPAGATIVGDVFVGVTPGSTVTFDVAGFNDFQPAIAVDQLFEADINVLGDIVTLLDVHNVFIIVPREITVPNVPQ